MKKEEVLEITRLLTENSEELKPVIKGICNVAEDLTKEFKPIIQKFIDFMVDEQIRIYVRFINAGFRPEDAMLLTLNAKVSLDSINTKKK